jgi:hypothetical protein
MVTRTGIFILFIGISLMANAQQHTDSGNIKVTKIEMSVTEDDVQPPPPKGLLLTFNTLEDWLSDIIDGNKPQKPISKYKLGLFEASNEYDLFLAGVNTYDANKPQSYVRTEFEPGNMYFRLPKNYFENLTRDQLLAKITSQLKDFVKTEKFRTSFLSKSNIIVFESNGQTIWSR